MFIEHNFLTYKHFAEGASQNTLSYQNVEKTKNENRKKPCGDTMTSQHLFTANEKRHITEKEM